LKRPLGLLFGLLVAIVAAELSYGTGDGKGTSQATEAMHVMPAATKSAASPATSVDQWVAVALARPLFAPDRKPVASASGDAGLPRLTGIVASSNDGVAIFQANENKKVLLVRRGETIAGWQVTRIAGDTVGLRKADNQIVLRPQFENSKSSGAAKEATQPQSRWEVAAQTGILRGRWSNPQLQP
jgi:hypothetical protein